MGRASTLVVLPDRWCPDRRTRPAHLHYARLRSVGDIQMDLSGETALVTGAGGGMGRAIAESLADGGADVVLNDVVEALPTTPGKIRREELREWE